MKNKKDIKNFFLLNLVDVFVVLNISDFIKNGFQTNQFCVVYFFIANVSEVFYIINCSCIPEEESQNTPKTLAIKKVNKRHKIGLSGVRFSSNY